MEPKIKQKATELNICFDDNINTFEIGVDEAGRGPLFGRVYVASVILPKDTTFDHFKMKDSKKFHNKKTIKEVSDYIKENAIAWSISYEDETTIDSINILQATQLSMHKSILKTIENNFTKTNKKQNYKLLIDGNYFKPIKDIPFTEHLDYICIEGGDNKYTAIAAASILAKVARDQYIEELCNQYPELDEHYSILSNKGYGAKKHIEGIKEHGITIWHRRSFGICKSYT